MTDDSDFVSDLRRQLIGAAERRNIRRRRRHRRLRRVGIAAGLLLTAGIVSITAAPKSQASVLRIETRGTAVTVNLVTPTASPKSIKRDLEKVGLHASVKSVPVADPMVGHFVEFETGPVITPLNGSHDSFDAFEVDTTRSKTVTLALGRKARAGESYVRFFDAYAAGGPFHCSGLWGQRAVEVAPRMTSLYAGSIEWKHASGAGLTPTSPSESPRTFVTDAELVAPNRMLVILSDTPESPLVSSPSSGPHDCTV